MEEVTKEEYIAYVKGLPEDSWKASFHTIGDPPVEIVRDKDSGEIIAKASYGWETEWAKCKGEFIKKTMYYIKNKVTLP